MADFQLELDVFANTAKLEAGLANAQAKVEQSARNIEKSSSRSSTSIGNAASKSSGSFDKMATAAAKAGGVIMAVQGSLKLVEAALLSINDKGTAAGDALTQLPIVGGLASGYKGVALAIGEIVYAAENAKRALSELKKAQEATLASETGKSLSKRIATETELLRQQGKTELEIAEAVKDMKIKLVEAEYQVRYREMGDFIDAEHARIREATKGNEEAGKEQFFRFYMLNAERTAMMDADKAAQIAAIEAEHNRLKIEQEQTQEIERQEQILQRQNEMAEAAEQHHEAMLEIERQRVKEQEEAERAAKKAEEERLAMVNARLQMEREITQARAEAQAMVAGATATFSTAGGSFTTGVSAQVNEAKLLTKISQQSRDFLAQIVQNTAMMVGGMSLA